VLARLDEIAKGMPPGSAARIAALVANLRAARAVQPARAPSETLETYYRRLDDDAPA
jgi:hypothetical protein